MKSMTGFAKTELHSKSGHFICEIVATNKKHLEIQLSVPKPLVSFVPTLRSCVALSQKRGHFKIEIQWIPSKQYPTKMMVNHNLALALKEGWDDLGKLFGESQVDLSFLREEKDLFISDISLEDDEVLLEDLETLLKKTLAKLEKMQQKEGAVLQQQLLSLLEELQEQIKIIKSKTQNLNEVMWEKAKQKMERWKIDDQEIVAKEVALLLTKSDVEEETVRLESHLKQLKDLFSEQESIGKKGDFLLQETLREVGTLGAKVAVLDLSKHIVEVKCLCETIREQLHNIQ